MSRKESPFRSAHTDPAEHDLQPVTTSSEQHVSSWRVSAPASLGANDPFPRTVSNASQAGGVSVGLAVGAVVEGLAVGETVGLSDGDCVGLFVGAGVGVWLGDCVGVCVGDFVGSSTWQFDD